MFAGFLHLLPSLVGKFGYKLQAFLPTITDTMVNVLRCVMLPVRKETVPKTDGSAEDADEGKDNEEDEEDNGGLGRLKFSVRFWLTTLCNCIW